MEKWKKTLLSLCLVLALGVAFLPVSVQAAEDALPDDLADADMEIMPDGPEAEEDGEESPEEQPDDTQTEEDEDEDEEEVDPTSLPAPVLTGADTAAVQDNAGNWYSVVQVTWEAVEGADRYQILRRTEDSAWETAGYASETEYLDYDVTLYNTYTYTVCCTNSAGDSSGPYDETGATVYYPSGSCGEQVSWKLSTGGVLEISGSGSMVENYDMEQTPWYALSQSITRAQVGEGVTHLSGYTFQGCTALEEVSLPESLTSMGRYAFFDCEVLQKVNLPQGLTEIPERAFYRCPALKELTLPEGLTVIGKGAFDGCTALNGLDLPQSLTEIGTSAFSGCNSLTQIAIPEGVTELGLNTFYGCSGLQEITFPEGFTTLGDYALSGCSGLTSLELPASLTRLGSGALRGCAGLEAVWFRGDCPEVGSDAFLSTGEIRAYYPVDGQSWTATRRLAMGDSLIWIGWTPETGAVQPCATPVLTQVSNTADGVGIRWNSVEGAEQYRVLRWNDAVGRWDVLSDIAELSYLDTGVSGGDVYRYTVCCLVGGQQASGCDVEGKSVRYLTVPAVKAVNSAGGITVTWTASAGAEKYVIYRKQPGGQWKSLGTVQAGETRSYLDTGVEDLSGSSFYYTVCAVQGSSRSDYVRDVSLYRLAQPQVKAASASKGIAVTWSQSAGAECYRIYRKTESSGWKQVAAVTGEKALSYSDTSVQNSSGTAYFYTVRAQKGSSLSSYHTSGVKVTYLTQPAVTAVNGSTGVNVSWTKVTGAEGYLVYRKSAGTGWMRIATIQTGGTLQYTDQTSSSGTSYFYTVRSYKSGSLSSYESPGAKVTCLSQPVVSVYNGSAGVNVSWKKVEGATGYLVYRKTSGGSWSRVTTIQGGGTLQYTDQAVKSKNGNTYLYTVRAVKSGSLSSYHSGKSIIRLSLPGITKVTNSGSREFTVQWGKNSKATGYQIQYATDSGFSDAKTVNVTSGSTVRATISELIKAKTYYVRVRSICTSGSTTSYSGWSAAKSVKITK
ncbi:MAG: leucine-rich repeat protein [Candidatus Onthomonas sp.]